MILFGHLMLDPHRIPQPGWIEVDEGRITRVEPGSPPRIPDAGQRGALILPGFIDAHMHVPQIGSIGCDGLDLLDWLDTVIFPAESRWNDPNIAKRDVERAVNRLIHAGTLGVAGYLSPHDTGLNLLQKHPELVPIRAMLGQAAVDRAVPPELLGLPLAHPTSAGRVEGSINPRFAVACTERLLQQSSDLARETGAMIQTHLAESMREVDRVRTLFPDARDYTSVYDRFNLLNERTLLAHAVHLSDEEFALIAERGSVIVHCPTANTFLTSGCFDLDRARSSGVRLALGTDIAAGPDASMPRIARAMIEVAKSRAMLADHAGHTDPVWIPSPSDALSMITQGNADALGWADSGRIAVGCHADLLVIHPRRPIDEHWAGRLIYDWDDGLIDTRVIGGSMHEWSAFEPWLLG